MGGLTSAIALRRAGYEVHVFEARPQAGGLASFVDFGGHRFDGGPYILLDREGLEYAFNALGRDFSTDVGPLIRLDPVYSVETPDGDSIQISASVDQTADALEAKWAGSGDHYRTFIQRTHRTHQDLRPMLQRANPTVWHLIRTGGYRWIPFLLGSAGDALRKSQLPQEVVNALGIWTHVAGQSLNQAPGPVSFVPSICHSVGAWVPERGIGTIPESLARVAVEEGVHMHLSTKISRIEVSGGAVCGLVTEAGDRFAADAVVSNVGLSTYLRMLPDDVVSSRVRASLRKLPLQSPGICVYLKAYGRPDNKYLRFLLPGEGALCRSRIDPGALTADTEPCWRPMRLITPLAYQDAQSWSESLVEARIQELFAESWWRTDVQKAEILGWRSPRRWADAFHLYGGAMNPVMTKELMRKGRLRHQSPYVKGLYLAGSGTHPGQWVSFCALSGLSAAQCVMGDT